MLGSVYDDSGEVYEGKSQDEEDFSDKGERAELLSSMTQHPAAEFRRQVNVRPHQSLLRTLILSDASTAADLHCLFTVELTRLIMALDLRLQPNGNLSTP